MEHLTAINQSKLKSASSILDDIIEIGTTFITQIRPQRYPHLTFTFIIYTERFNFNLKSIRILLPEFESEPKIETSIGLIIRASLLDYITILYFSTFLSDIKKDPVLGNEALEKALNEFLTDHIRFSIQHLTLVRDRQIISNNEYKSELKKIHDSYKFLFKPSSIDYEHPEDALKSRRRFKSPKELFNYIRNHPITASHSIVYSLYIYYGKYEHYGIMTHYLQAASNKNFINIMDGLIYLIDGLEISMFMYANALKIPYNPEPLESLKSQLKKL